MVNDPKAKKISRHAPFAPDCGVIPSFAILLNDMDLAIDEVRRDTLATQLLTRVLRMMRLAGGIKVTLFNESVAYQLVWPD